MPTWPYHQIVTIKMSKNRNYLEFWSLLVFLVDNVRKFPKKSQNVAIWWVLKFHKIKK